MEPSFLIHFVYHVLKGKKSIKHEVWCTGPVLSSGQKVRLRPIHLGLIGRATPNHEHYIFPLSSNTLNQTCHFCFQDEIKVLLPMGTRKFHLVLCLITSCVCHHISHISNRCQCVGDLLYGSWSFETCKFLHATVCQLVHTQTKVKMAGNVFSTSRIPSLRMA